VGEIVLVIAVVFALNWLFLDRGGDGTDDTGYK
jgi:hypothetical protein